MIAIAVDTQIDISDGASCTFDTGSSSATYKDFGTAVVNARRTFTIIVFRQDEIKTALS